MDALTVAVLLEHKRGSTFSAECQYTDDAGIPVPLGGITIKSQFRTPEGKLVSECEATITDESAGKFSLKVPAEETSRWPVQRLDWDIQYRLNTGDVIASDTVSVQVIKYVTR